MMPAELRSLENTDKMEFYGVGRFGIPELQPVYHIPPDDIPLDMVAFDVCKRLTHPDRVGVHFYMPDFKMARIWTHPDIYTPMLERYRFVCTPDFSMYTNWPMALQINSHYRKQWVGAYWQRKGMVVIPTVTWSDESSYEWCFDGVPAKSIVAVSSVGTQAEKETRYLFTMGFYRMMERLQPQTVLFHGDIPKTIADFIAGNQDTELIKIEPYHRRLRRMEGRE